MTFVVRAQPVLDRLVANLLQLRIERRRHRETILVQRLRAVMPFEVLAHFLDEEGRDARRLVWRAARDDWPLPRRLGLVLRDVVLVRHALQHDVAPLRGAPHVDERTLALRRLEDAGNERRFLEIQLLVRFVEVQPRSRLDTVRAVTEVHLIAVDREDFLLRVPLLDLDREDRFANLALEQLLFGQPELIEVARDLLRERARALLPPPLHDVDERRGKDAPDVDAEMPVEIGVFGGDDRLAQHRIDVVVSDDNAPLRREFPDQLSLRGVDARDGAGRIVVERGDLREVVGVREHHSAQDAEHRRDDEERHDAGVAGDADDVMGHEVSVLRSGGWLLGAGGWGWSCGATRAPHCGTNNIDTPRLKFHNLKDINDETTRFR